MLKLDFFSRLKNGIDYINTNIRDLQQTVKQEMFWTSELSQSDVSRIVTFVDGIYQLHDELQQFYTKIIDKPVTLDAAEQRLANIYKSVGVNPAYIEPVEFTPGISTRPRPNFGFQAPNQNNTRNLTTPLRGSIAWPKTPSNRQMLKDIDLPMNPVLKSVKKLAPKAPKVHGTPEMPKLRVKSMR